MHLLPLLLLLLPGLGPALAQGPCCEVRIVKDYGPDLDGVYMHNQSPTADLEDPCVDACVYSKIGGKEGDEYCFKDNKGQAGNAECQAVTTEPPVTGSTVTQSAEDLKKEEESVTKSIENDEKDLKNLDEEEADADAVDNEIDGVESKINELVNGGPTTTSRRSRRQAAGSCTEIATLVGELETETDTKKKLVKIRKITQTKIVSCTDDEGRQALVVIKQTDRIRTIKRKNKDRIMEIRDRKVKVSIKIIASKKRLCKLLAKQGIYRPPCPKPITKPMPTKPNRPTKPGTGRPPFDGTGTSMEPTGQTAVPIKPTGETPIPVEPTGEQPITINPTGEQPIPIDPTGETPIPIDPSGETPIPIEPTGEKPIPIDPTGETPITIQPTGEQPIPVDPTGETPIVIGPMDVTKFSSAAFNSVSPGF